MPDNRQRIEQIQKILRAGATQVTTDGTTVSFDFAQLRKELRRLMAEDPAFAGRRPVAASIKFGS